MKKKLNFLNSLFWYGIVYILVGPAGFCATSHIAYSTDIKLGKEGALTVIEYSSLSCGGCAYFAKKIFPAIEKEYIQTGKIRLVIRQMVMNENDVKASMLVCCAPVPHKLQLAYWQKQHEWMGEGNDEAIRKIAKENGMTDTQIDSCLANTQLRQTLFTKKFIALKGYDIKSIPVILINNKPCPPIENVEQLRKMIEQALKEAHNKADK